MTHVHLIGIGGSGLSAIARLLLESGYTVSGSDQSLSPLALSLRAAGATVFQGHAPQNVRGADWVVRSSAVSDTNPEVQAALTQGIPVFKRADFLGKLMQGKTGIAIAGTHGKTTTSAFTAWMLHSLRRSPSFIVGGVLNNLGVNARAGQGAEFVIEADEYDRMFLGLRPQYAVITNVEHDHPDCYPTPADFKAAFSQFASLIPSNGALIACAEDQGALDVMNEARRAGTRVVSYRISTDGRTEAGEGAIARSVRPNNLGGFTFDVILRLNGMVQYLSTVELTVPGLHNVRNSLAALVVAGLLNLPIKDAAASLRSFAGTGRRFEILGEANGILIVDDYAHHPTEIRATLAAARARYPARRLWVVWQPHTYSRLQTLFDEFALAFGDANQVIVSEVYAAREKNDEISARSVVQAIRNVPAEFIPALDDIRASLLQRLAPGDVLLVLSAGDANRVSREVLQALQEKA